MIEIAIITLCVKPTLNCILLLFLQTILSVGQKGKVCQGEAVSRRLLFIQTNLHTNMSKLLYQASNTELRSFKRPDDYSSSRPIFTRTCQNFCTELQIRSCALLTPSLASSFRTLCNNNLLPEIQPFFCKTPVQGIWDRCLMGQIIRVINWSCFKLAQWSETDIPDGRN